MRRKNEGRGTEEEIRRAETSIEFSQRKGRGNCLTWRRNYKELEASSTQNSTSKRREGKGMRKKGKIEESTGKMRGNGGGGCVLHLRNGQWTTMMMKDSRFFFCLGV